MLHAVGVVDMRAVSTVGLEAGRVLRRFLFVRRRELDVLVVGVQAFLERPAKAVALVGVHRFDYEEHAAQQKQHSTEEGYRAADGARVGGESRIWICDWKPLKDARRDGAYRADSKDDANPPRNVPPGYDCDHAHKRSKKARSTCGARGCLTVTEEEDMPA